MTPETLLDLFVLSPVGMAEVDEDGQVEVANLAARRLLAPFTPAGALDDLFTALAGSAPDLVSRIRGYDAPRGVVVEGLALIAPGTQHGVQLSVVKVEPQRYVVVVSDAAGTVQANRVCTRLDAQLRAVDGALRDVAIFTLGLTGQIDTWNASAERLHQWTSDEALGQPVAMLAADSAAAEAAMHDALHLAARNGWTEEEGFRARRDGTTFWANTITTVLRGADGATLGYSIVTRDLSERRKLEEAARGDTGSGNDYLTGVAARRAFFEVAGSEVARGRRYGQPLSLLLVEPDHFRDLQEEHGEAFTDEWLRAIAAVCRQESRTTDVVGRVGGEEFAVLLPSTELSGGLVLAERIRERMQRHVFPGEHQGVRCTVSVGVAELTDNVASVDALLTASEQAVEHARQAGRNLVVGYDA